MYSGVVIKHNRFENLLLSVGIFSLLFLGLLIIAFAAYPLFKDQSYESNANEVLEVHTSTYRKGSPAYYPVGALDLGLNSFRIENTTNETIQTFFVLKLQNYWCDEVEIEYSIDGYEKSQIKLIESYKGSIRIPMVIKNKANLFLELNLISKIEYCSDNQGREFPLSINQWSFREE